MYRLFSWLNKENIFFKPREKLLCFLAYEQPVCAIRNTLVEKLNKLKTFAHRTQNICTPLFCHEASFLHLHCGLRGETTMPHLPHSVCVRFIQRTTEAPFCNLYLPASRSLATSCPDGIISLIGSAWSLAVLCCEKGLRGSVYKSGMAAFCVVFKSLTWFLRFWSLAGRTRSHNPRWPYPEFPEGRIH